MIYQNFGLGSGVQYRYFNTDFFMGDDKSPKFPAKWTFQSINIPFNMIFSLRGNNLSLSLMTGGVYSHLFYSLMTTGPSMYIANTSDNALKYIQANQFGLTSGVIFRIKITQFTDLIFGATGEYYPMNLLSIQDDSKSELHMYNYSLTAGYMFRTNIFPGAEK